jgi:hypothetical protein
MVIGVLVGCGSIYSPTLHLPYAPLAKETGQLTAAASALPQIGTSSVGFAGSGEGQASYGFSDRLTLSVKAWSQMSEIFNRSYNGGISAGASVLLCSPADEHSIQCALLPSGSMLLNGNSVSALGSSIQLGAWLPALGAFRPYAALGGGFLAKNFRDDDWGYGMVWNAGVAWKCSEVWRVNLELFGAIERYRKNYGWDAYLAPSLSLSWTFDNR